MSSTEKIALVTGASRGIGRAIVDCFINEGAKVIATASSEKSLSALKKAFSDSDITCIAADLADEQSLLSLVQKVQDEFGKIDYLVNNAGITYSATIEDTPTKDWDRVMAVNARGPYILCRECLPMLKKAKQGVIVNISSVVGVKGYAKQTLYGSSKHALRGMSIALAEELREDGIRVHVICPGGVNTDMVDQVRPDIPKDELIRPEQIADLVKYLCFNTTTGVIDEIHLRRATSAPWF